MPEQTRPACFTLCACGDNHITEEHCTNRDFPVPTRCHKCPFYFGFLEHKKAEQERKA